MKKILFFFFCFCALATVNALNTPTLSSPSNGSTLTTISASLQWNSVSGSNRYQWECDTEPTFNSPMLVSGSCTSYYATATGLHYGKTYYWRVRACAATDTSSWSTVRTFTTPARVTLSSPSNGATLSSIGVSLEWNSMSGTSQYQYQCDTSENFDSQLLVSRFTSSYYATASGLHYGRTYYWRVRSCTSVDTSEWSLVRTFTTPARVTLSSPSNGATLSSIGVSLEWNSMSGTSQYQYQCDTSENFDSQLLVSRFTSSYYATASGLHYGRTYYWRVRSCTSVDTSEWSLVRTFTTPFRVTLSSPSNGATLSSIGVSLEWNSMSGTSQYQYQCDTSENFDSQLLVSRFTSSYYATASGLHYGRTYYWRVRSCTSVDTSEWSLVRTFTTPARVTLSSPSNGANLSSLSTSLQWNSISGSTRYIYQYDVTPAFNTTHLISNTTSSYYTSINGLSYNTTYYWRVCAYNSVDTSDWSLVRTFRTGTLNMTAIPTLVSPANGSTAIPTDGQTFTWDAYPNALSYEIEYSTYNDFADNIGFQTVTATNTHLFSLDAHTTYYWRVRAANGVDFSPWSNVWSFTTENCSVEIFDTEDVTICESDLPYTYRDTIFDSGTTSATFQFTDVLSGICDTIHRVTLNLTVNPIYTIDVYQEICAGQLPYTYGNTTFPQGTVTGIYPLSYTTDNGCDSTVNLHLTVVDAINTAFSVTACGSYTWNNVTYTQSGIYTQNFVSIVGCDSIVSLDLTLTSILYTNITETACETYTWNGETYTQSGTYTQTLTSANNCDSVVTLDLTITHPVEETISVASCGSYLWNNQLYTVSGTYQQSFPASNGCDSIVTMQLTVNQSVNTQEELAICESDLPYTWSGIVFNEAGTETVALTAANGCDSIVTLVLSVTEVNTDIYNIVLTSAQGFAEMHVDQQNAQYQWINCGTQTPIANATSSVFTPTEAGHYACIITYNNCTDTTECIEATLQGRVNDIDAQNLRIYPNPASDFVVVEGDALQQIQLFNMEGQLLNSITLENDEQYQLSTAQLPAGAYLLRIATVDGEVAKMLIVE